MLLFVVVTSSHHCSTEPDPKYILRSTTTNITLGVVVVLGLNMTALIVDASHIN